MIKNVKNCLIIAVSLIFVCSIIYDMYHSKKVVFKNRNELLKEYHYTIKEITKNEPYINTGDFTRQGGVTYVSYLYQDKNNQSFIDVKNTLRTLNWRYINNADIEGSKVEYYCKNGDGIELGNLNDGKFYIKMYWDKNGICQ